MFDILNAGPKTRFTVLTKDGPLIVSNCVQSSGHDCLMIYISILSELLSNAKFEYKWVIPDFHDETILQCPEENAEQLAQLMRQGLGILNKKIKELNPLFELDIKGEPAIVDNFAAIKLGE